MSEEFAFDVFLSYSARNKQLVREIAERLKSDDVRVWFDEDQLSVGDNILFKIEEGLERSRVLVLCMSADAFGAEWPHLEAGTFRFRDPLNKNRRFIPLRLDDAPIKGTLTQFAYINWRSENLEQEYRKLLAACRAETNWSAKRQRICMISSEFPPNIFGGLGVHVTSLSRAIAADADLDLVLPHRREGYAPPPAGANVRALSRVEANYDDPISWVHFAQHATALIERIQPKPEVIHCHDWVTVLAGVACRYRLKIPLLYHVHLPNRTPFCSSVENLGLMCADLVTVNSQAMAEQVKDRFPNKRIAVVPNGVDTTLFKPVDETAHSPPYVLFVGRLVEQKGVDHLLRAFVHVLKRFPDLELKIVGKGPCEAAYQRLADCLLLNGHVKFLGWKVGEELRDLYQSAAVAAVPSVYEPFGMTALEAMACGCSVVASDTGGLKELVRHQETGCLAEPGDHLDLAQWIIRLLHSSHERRTLGRQAARFVQAGDYQWSSIARQYLAFYHKLSCEQLDLRIAPEARNFVWQIRELAGRLDFGSLSAFNAIIDW